MLRLQGTAFGTLDANVADACVYRGKSADAVVAPDPAYAKDAAYAAELKRRAEFAP